MQKYLLNIKWELLLVVPKAIEIEISISNYTTFYIILSVSMFLLQMEMKIN